MLLTVAINHPLYFGDGDLPRVLLASNRAKRVSRESKDLQVFLA